MQGDSITDVLIFLLFGIGLILIIRGGDRFVDAAVWMAAASRIPSFIIGATVVSLATTLPETVVSLMAAMNGQTGMAAGNAIGSVTANTALILAFSVIVLPEPIDRSRYLPKALLLIASVSVLWLAGLSGYIAPFGCSAMLVLFGVFLYESIHSAKKERSRETAFEPSITKAQVIKNILFFVLGAGEIILGSRLLVDNGTLIARDILGIDERVISLTMVAVGTSLPELVTAVGAVIKKNSSLAVGNILGANIMDVIMILPLCALTQGGILPLSTNTLWVDIPFCLSVIMIMIIPALVKRRFYRAQGVITLILYGIYTIFLFISDTLYS